MGYAPGMHNVTCESRRSSATGPLKVIEVIYAIDYEWLYNENLPAPQSGGLVLGCPQQCFSRVALNGSELRMQCTNQGTWKSCLRYSRSTRSASFSATAEAL